MLPGCYINSDGRARMHLTKAFSRVDSGDLPITASLILSIVFFLEDDRGRGRTKKTLVGGFIRFRIVA